MSEAKFNADRPIIRVAVCGEVRSGKSAMLNALLRENILDDNLGNDARPTIFAEYGDEVTIDFFTGDHQVIDLSAHAESDDNPNIATIQMCHDRADLAAFEFVEVPLTSAENLTSEQVALIQSSNIMIWVTIASQAWRLTEKSILDELKDARPRHSVLAISRGDKLRQQSDREKIMQRMQRETGEYFDRRVFVNNSRRQISETATSATAWADSGAAEVLAVLHGMADEIASEMENNRKARKVSRKKAQAAEDAAAQLQALVSPEMEQLADSLGRGVHVGICTAEDPENCVVLRGGSEVCQKVGMICRDLQNLWLSAYADAGAAQEDFGIVLQTPSQTVHFAKLPGQVSLFSLSHNEEVNSGMVQNKFNQIRKTILETA